MRNLKWLGCCLLGLAALGIVASAAADVPRLIHYQGKLLTSPDGALRFNVKDEKFTEFKSKT